MGISERGYPLGVFLACTILACYKIWNLSYAKG